jgi:hypothetical protein
VFEVEYIKKKGKDLFIFGKQIVVLDVRGLYHMKKELEKGVEKPDEMLYEAGRLSLMEIHESLVASLGDAAGTILSDRESALDMLVDALNHLGLGEISILEFKPKIRFAGEALRRCAGLREQKGNEQASGMLCPCGNVRCCVREAAAKFGGMQRDQMHCLQR